MTPVAIQHASVPNKEGEEPMWKVRLQYLAAMFAAVTLGGCAATSSLSTGSTGPRVFDLVAAEPASDAAAIPAKQRNVQVVVEEPAAVRSLDGDRVMVRLPNAEISSLAGASWSDRLPRLVQARVMTALTQSQHFRSVGNGREKAGSDLVVASEITAFQINAGKSGDAATVALDVKLIEDRSGNVVATRVLRSTVPVSVRSTDGSMQALNAAFAEVSTELVDWVATVPVKSKSGRSKNVRRKTASAADFLRAER
jgi:cholesterol transport system auxiliary component